MNTSAHHHRRVITLTYAALTVVGLAAAACSSTTPAAAPTTTPATTPGTAAPAAPTPGSTPAAAGPGAITVKLFQFKPSPLTIPAGTKVTWTSEDDTVHEPASGTPEAPTTVFDVELDGKGSSGSFTFTTPGTYAYYCKIHTSMTGEITVT